MAVAGIVLPTAGAYTGLWNAWTLGIQNDDGFELSCTLEGQEIRETDAFGMSMVEAIQRGQNWRLRLRGLEWNRSGLLGAEQMFGRSVAPGVANMGIGPWGGLGAAGGNTTTPLNPDMFTAVGNRWTAFCNTLLLTAVLTFPPCTPATLTALSAGVSPGSQSSFNFTSKMREFPLEFVLFPYQGGPGNAFVIPFSTT